MIAYREPEDFGKEGSSYSEGFGSDADFDEDELEGAFGDDDDDYF